MFFKVNPLVDKKKLLLLDVHEREEMASVDFISNIIEVIAIKQWVVVALSHQVLIFDF